MVEANKTPRIIDEKGNPLKQEELIKDDFIWVFSESVASPQLFQFIKFEYDVVWVLSFGNTNDERLLRQSEITTIKRLGRDTTGCIAAYIRNLTTERDRLAERLNRINTKFKNILE